MKRSRKDNARTTYIGGVIAEPMLAPMPPEWVPVPPPSTPRLRGNPRHVTSPRSSSRPKYIRDGLSQSTEPHMAMDVHWNTTAPDSSQTVTLEDDGHVRAVD